jgi:hypothetical protein
MNTERTFTLNHLSRVRSDMGSQPLQGMPMAEGDIRAPTDLVSAMPEHASDGSLPPHHEKAVMPGHPEFSAVPIAAAADALVSMSDARNAKKIGSMGDYPHGRGGMDSRPTEAGPGG